MDNTYLEHLKTLSLSPKAIIKQKDLSIVFTGIHGTGAVMVPRALKVFGFNNVTTVASQDK